MITHSKIAGEGDEPHYMMISQSLIFDGDIDLANNYADKNNIIQNGRLNLNSKHIKLGNNGAYYPIHDIGMPLLYAPIYGIVELASMGIWFAIPEPLLKKIKLDPFGILTGLMAFWGIFLTSVLVYMLYSVSWCLTKDKVTAFWGCLLFGLSPPMLSFSYLYFTELTSAIIILYIFSQIIFENYQWQKSIMLGLLLGLLFLVHTRNAGSVSAFGIILFSKYLRVNLRSCFIFAFSFFVVIALRSCLNYFLWNSMITTPHASFSLHASFLYNIKEIFIRLFGWLFDREHGLYVFAPVYCLMFAGLHQLFLKNRKISYDMTMIISMYVIIMALPFFNRHGWGGDGLRLVDFYCRYYHCSP